MSTIFMNVIRHSIRVVQTPLIWHANIGRLAIERKYSKILDPEHKADLSLDDWFSDEGKKKKSRKRSRYNPKPKTPKPLKINAAAGKVITINTCAGARTYTSFVDNEEVIENFMLDLKSRRRRKLRNCVMLEGKVLITDAIKAGCVPNTILFSRVQDIINLPLPKDITLYKTRYRTLQLWSTLTTSPGVMGIFEKPNLADRSPAADAIPLTIICNNIRNPGNLGSILRNAATVGCERLIITKGCVDLWSPKVLRAASGAHFFMPISTEQPWNQIIPLIEPDANIYIADNTIAFDGDVDVNSASDLTNSKVNSRQTSLENDSEDDDGDNDTSDDYEGDGSINHFKDDENYELEGNERNAVESAERRVITKEERQNLLAQVSDLKSKIPVVPYHTINFTENHSVLVIGGETEGLSLELLHYFPKHKTVRVHIPLSNGFDSLNTSTAVGILAFEIKRQFLCEPNELD